MPPSGYTIFCDDIRHEVDNKITFVGTYRGKLIARGNLPLVLPKFGFAIVYDEQRGESTEPVTFRIFLPGDADDNASIEGQFPVEAMRNQEEDLSASPEDCLLRLEAHLVIAPLELKMPGRIRVRAYRGHEIIKLGSISVEVEPIPESTPTT